jgi:beta-hydroxyacyl-ACP dehydratase FabZ
MPLKNGSKGSKKMADAADIHKILAYLPHRYPFILIDRVLELQPGDRIKALKNVTINEPFFQGHFPGLPIMPGVLIVEAMGQAGGVLFMESLPPEKRGLPVYFMSIDKVRFRRPVVPGDQLILDLRIIKARAKAVKMEGTALVDGAKAAEAQFMATIGEAADEEEAATP